MSQYFQFTAGCMAIVLLGAGCGQRSSHGASSVPWADLPALKTVNGAAVTLPACSSPDFHMALGNPGAYRGYATQEMRLTNVGVECRLELPLRIELSDGSQAIHVGNAQSGSSDVVSGATISVVIGAPGTCAGVSATNAHRYTSASVVVGAGRLSANGLSIDSQCGPPQLVSLSVAPSPGEAPPGVIQLPLQAKLSVPSTASRTQLTYKVVLTNAGGAPYAFGVCPTYTERLNADGRIAEASYQLNCSHVNAIPVGGSVSFDIVFPLAASMPTGLAKLGWAIVGSQVAVGTTVILV